MQIQLVLAGDGLHPASLIVRFFANILNIFVTQALVFGLAFCYYSFIRYTPHYNRYGNLSYGVPGAVTIMLNQHLGPQAALSILFAQPFFILFGVIMGIINPGKTLMGLKIVNFNGIEVGFGTKFLRYLLTIFLSVFDGLRFFICCCPGRTCADLLLDTYVVDAANLKIKRI